MPIGLIDLLIGLPIDMTRSLPMVPRIPMIPRISLREYFEGECFFMAFMTFITGNIKIKKSLTTPSFGRGQGTLEYILLLFVVVALALFLKFGFFDSFGSFAQNYFGEYLQCLLETGELPRFGELASDSVKRMENAQGRNICNTSFVPFTLRYGRPPSLGSGGGATSSGGGPSSSSQRELSASSRSISDSNPNSNPDSNPNSNPQRITYPRRGGGSYGGTGRGGGNSPNEGGANAGKKKSTKKNQEGDSSYGGMEQASLAMGEKSKKRRIAFTRKGKIEGKKKEKIKVHKKSKKKSNETGNPIKNQRTQVNLQKRKAASETKVNLSFGKLLKILFILLMLIGFCVLIGSQALKFMKSYEK